MSTLLRCAAFSLVLMLAAPSFVVAATAPTSPTGDLPITLGRSRDVLSLALRPAPAPTAPTALPRTELPEVRLARVPSYPMTMPTVLAAASQPIGFQGGTWTSNRHVRWALTGAVVGLIIGLLDDDPGEKALIGAAVGFGLSYVVTR